MSPIYYHVFVDPSHFEISEGTAAVALIAMFVVVVVGVGSYLYERFKNRK